MIQQSKQVDENAFYRQDWVSRAACRGIDDPSIFCTPDRESRYVVARNIVAGQGNLRSLSGAGAMPHLRVGSP